MGFPLDEVARGIDRLLERIGGVRDAASTENTLRWHTTGGVTIEAAAVPSESVTHPSFHARTRLILRGEAAPVEKVHRDIVYAFLRVGG